MTDKELSEKFRNSANCWADDEDAVQAMDEQKAIEFAKEYAATQVADRDSKDANKAIQACAQFSCAIAAAKDLQIAALVEALTELREICKEVDENPDYTFAENDAKLFVGICDRALEAHKKGVVTK